MATLVPTNLNLLECLASQLLVDRTWARTAFPGVELDSLPQECELFLLTPGSRLVAHHGTGISEVWEVWEPDGSASYWCQLNGLGVPL